ncbi:hypothetical protein HAX54_033112, partial [Datura stramonium]|nr:hypothetical protein [Datura stramonium]
MNLNLRWIFRRCSISTAVVVCTCGRHDEQVLHLQRVAPACESAPTEADWIESIIAQVEIWYSLIILWVLDLELRSFWRCFQDIIGGNIFLRDWERLKVQRKGKIVRTRSTIAEEQELVPIAKDHARSISLDLETIHDDELVKVSEFCPIQEPRFDATPVLQDTLDSKLKVHMSMFLQVSRLRGKQLVATIASW